MTRKRSNFTVLAVVLVLGILAFFLLQQFWGAQPGFNLVSTIRIKYDDGSERTLSSEENLLGQRLSVLTDQGKKVETINVVVYGVWKSSPPGQAIKTQYWMFFYIKVRGPFYSGGRVYSSLTGFSDIVLSSYTDTVKTDRWWYISNNIVPSAYFTNYFYQERGSGLQVGGINFGPDIAYQIEQSLSSNKVAKDLASKLTTLLGTVQVNDGGKVTVVDWSIKGYDFYTYMKRCEWNGAAISIGDFTIGAGKWARMWDGDSYSIEYHVAYFFRWQDKTGEWSDWKTGDVTIGSMTLAVQPGYWVSLDLSINGNAQVISGSELTTTTTWLPYK